MTVEVRGELDIASENALRDVLAEALRRSTDGVELDLSAVTFCDCAALNVLLAAYQRALRRGKTFTIRAVSPAVVWLMDKTGMSSLLLTGNRPTKDTPPAGEGDLEKEVAQLRRAMRTRPSIDQAVGVLMATFFLSPDDAWSVLVLVSQNTNTKLHCIAENLLEAVQGDALPVSMRTHIAAAVDALRHSEGSPPG